MSIAHLAIDLGASSGRAILGVLDGNPLELRLEEFHRFEHLPCNTPTGPVWDLTGIWRNVLQGIQAATSWAASAGVEIASVGVDTWGVDCNLVGAGGELLALPHCYRDPRNLAIADAVVEQVGGYENLFARNGLQLMAFNTLFQVAAWNAAEPKLLTAADRLLMMPDLIHYWLTGKQTNERTNASTTAMLHLSGDWDRELMDQLGLPHHLLHDIIEPGTQLGPIREDLIKEYNLPADLTVIVPATHDTASAVAAIPVDSAKNEKWAYLNSGTWSLLGAELDQPITTPAAAAVPFTNELGVAGKVRFLKNIVGLWLIQELRRDLARIDREYEFSQLASLAEQAEPFRTVVNPEFGEFILPGDMIGKLRRYAASTGQPEPESAGQLARCCLESLALCYDYTLKRLEKILGYSVEKLYLVGGGIQNQLLNQLTADATGKSIACGPVEATAIGNVLVQAMGRGRLPDLAAARSVVQRSFTPQQLTPSGDAAAWDEPKKRYAALVAS